MEKTGRKKIIIIGIYFAIFALIIFGIYSLFPKENCFDGIKNQSEEDIDCGGVCENKCNKIEAQDLIVEKTGSVFSGISGKYDFYARVTNPNAIFGSKSFDYNIDFLDQSGNTIAQRQGSTFILPGERKYIVESNIESAEPAETRIKITNSNWGQFDDYQKPGLKVVNKTYNEISGGTGFSEARGLLKNESPFDFGIIKIQIILKNDVDEIVALNATEIRTVNSGEERDFRVVWPNHFPGKVSDMEVQAGVNVFDSEAFLKKYYAPRQFQQY